MIKIPDTILHALAAELGVDGNGLAYFGGGGESSDGTVYRFPWQNGDRLMKVIAVPAGDGAAMRKVEERLKFVHYLGEHGVNIVYPVDAGDGRLLAELVEGENRFIAYVMEKVSGEHLPPEKWTGEFYENFGRTIGGLHRVTQTYPLWTSIRDEASGKVILGWEEEWQFFAGLNMESEILERWVSIRERLERLPICRDSHGFIHNDPHTHNILVDGGCDTAYHITMLDFDVANIHWFMTDISIAIQELLFDVTGGIERPVQSPGPLRPTLEAFMHGYRSVNPLDDSWLDQIDLFISYRRILLWTVLQDFLSTHPDIRASWKNMILTEPPVFGQVSKR